MCKQDSTETLRVQLLSVYTAPVLEDDIRTALSPAGLAAWRALLVAQSRLVRELDAELQERHDLTLGDFDVLVTLADSKGGCVRMHDLADQVLLSPSGLTRRVDRLERAGIVERRRSAVDGRSVEARLTAAGKRLLRRLRVTHRDGVARRFASSFSESELEQLAEMLGRPIPGAGR